MVNSVPTILMQATPIIFTRSENKQTNLQITIIKYLKVGLRTYWKEEV